MSGLSTALPETGGEPLEAVCRPVALSQAWPPLLLGESACKIVSVQHRVRGNPCLVPILYQPDVVPPFSPLWAELIGDTDKEKQTLENHRAAELSFGKTPGPKFT